MSGSWKVAYADFVTAMMAFFLLMWILNAASEDTKAGLSEYFTEGTVNSGVGPGMAEVQQAVNLDIGGPGFSEIDATHLAIAQDLSQFINAEETAASNAGVSTSSSGVLLHITADLLFEPNSVVITPAGRAALDKVAETMRKHIVYLVVRGHSSTDETGAPDYLSKWDLAFARATSAVRYFVDNCALNPAYIRAVSFADTQPLYPESSNANSSGNRQNRRVEFFLHRPEVPAMLAGY